MPYVCRGELCTLVPMFREDKRFELFECTCDDVLGSEVGVLTRPGTVRHNRNPPPMRKQLDPTCILAGQIFGMMAMPCHGGVGKTPRLFVHTKYTA